MRTYSNYLDVNRFKRDFLSIYRDRDGVDAILDNIIEKISAVNKSIDSFLRAIDDVDDRKIQECCRIAAIAQKFQAKLDCRSGYPYIEVSAYSAVDIIALNYARSTAVVTKYGECIFDEGDIWLNIRNFRNGGFPVRKVVDGKYGFLSSSGSLVLPCIFDDNDMHIGEANFLFNHVNFRLRSFGQLSDVSNDQKTRLIEYYDESKMMYFVCNSVLFSLSQENLLSTDNKYVRLPKEIKAEATKAVKDLLADRIVTLEELTVD